MSVCRAQYVLNVTPDLPNTFEAEGCGINYLKIPIADHWSQNLAVHFPQAIRFIGKYTFTTLTALALKVRQTLRISIQRHPGIFCFFYRTFT